MSCIILKKKMNCYRKKITNLKIAMKSEALEQRNLKLERNGSLKKHWMAQETLALSVKNPWKREFQLDEKT